MQGFGSIDLNASIIEEENLADLDIGSFGTFHSRNKKDIAELIKFLRAVQNELR
jgi:hypothetical protein